MRRGLLAAVLLMFGASVLAAGPHVTLGTDCEVRIDGDGARLVYGLTPSKSSDVFETVNTKCDRPKDGALAYQLVRWGQLLANGRATLRVNSKGGYDFRHEGTARRQVKHLFQTFRLRLRVSEFAGCKWSAGGKSGTLPVDAERHRLFEGSANSFSFTTKEGRTWRVTLPASGPCVVMDQRFQDRLDFEVSFLFGKELSLDDGKPFSAMCTVSCDGAQPTLGVRDFFAINESEDWIRLDWSKDVKPNSALDFSRGPTRHTPAGSAGRLCVTNGQFVFQRRRAATQRFFGAAIGHDAAFAEKLQSNNAVKRLAKCGYNAIRLMYTDTRLVRNGKKGVEINPERSVKMDQLVTSAAKEGLYSFIDVLSTSRSWEWKDMGLTPPDNGHPQWNLCHALALFNDGAFEVWKKWAELVYLRKNKSANKLYPENLAVPLVQFISEGGAFQAWDHLKKLPLFREGYTAWLEAKRKKDSAFMEGKVCEPIDVSVVALHEARAGSTRRYLAEMEITGLRRCAEALRTPKSVALFGQNLGWKHFPDVAEARAASGDFSVGTFSFDVPRHLGERGGFPYRIDNANPLDRAAPIPDSMMWFNREDRPFVVSSWQAPAPSPWRASAGLLVGAWAAKHRWSGVWYEPYAMTAEGLDPFKGTPLDGQSSNDPMAVANERAVWALFARGDYPDNGDEDALTIRKGSITVITERTCGGFSPEKDGVIEAGPVTVQLSGYPAAVWVTSLTADPIATSKRMLVTHLTDMQTAGTLYSDSLCDLMQRRGTGPVLVRNGTAKISLEVKKPASYTVRAIGSDGVPLETLATDDAEGKLVFTAAVKGKAGRSRTAAARYLYEIILNK